MPRSRVGFFVQLIPAEHLFWLLVSRICLGHSDFQSDFVRSYFPDPLLGS